jgi:transposase
VSGGATPEDASWVGSLTALAFVLIIGKADRFYCGKQIASYLGLVPLETSSGNQRRLGPDQEFTITSDRTPCSFLRLKL